MRRRSLVGCPLVLILIALGGLSGCGEDKCEACPDEPCQGFVGLYLGQMMPAVGDCTDESLNIPNGEIQVDVLSILAEAEADNLQIVLTDSQGKWTAYSGTICNTLQDEAPFSFAFSASNTAMTQDGANSTKILSGSLTPAEPAGSATLNGTFRIAVRNAKNPQLDCASQSAFSAQP